MYVPDLCENPSILRMFLFFKYVLKIAYIVIPALVVIFGIIDMAKAAIANAPQDEIKKQAVTLAKRVIAALIVYLIPSVVNVLVNLTGIEAEKIKACNDNSTLEKIEYYEVMAPAKKAVVELEKDPTKANVEKAKAAVAKIASYGAEDTVIDYLTRISKAEVLANEMEEKLKCINDNGYYKNGYCTKIAHPPKDTSSSNNNDNGTLVFSNNDMSGDMKTINILGSNYKVVNTKAEVVSFSNTMISRGVRQNYNSSIYGDKCLGFAYTHAWGLYSGRTNFTAEDGKNYVGAGNFTTYINDSERDILGTTYEQLTQNKPVVIQVNGNKAGTSRHFVTVVGFKDTVKSANDIQATDLLILDSWDAKLERMDTDTSRFLTTGAACHKDYSGYRIQYLK